MVFGLKKVTCGGPINFQQLQLDKQVRGLRMEVDKDNDLIALPVVVVDTTGPQTVASTPLVIEFQYQAVNAFGNKMIWTPAAGKRIRLMGGSICGANLTLAAAAREIVTLNRGVPGEYFYLIQQYLDATTRDFQNVNFDYGLQGFLLNPDESIIATLGTVLATGAYFVHVWGREE